MANNILNVKAQILTCTNCDLSSECRQPIPVHSPMRTPKYLVLGEAPGQVEDRAGQPFVGPAGMFMKRSLRKAHLSVSDGAYLNTVSCFPKLRKTPTADEINSCRKNLYDQLDAYPTQPLLVCGSIALKALLPHADITYAMGMVFKAHGKLIFPVYHPAYVLRSRLVLESWERQLGEFADMVVWDTRPVSTRCMYCNSSRSNVTVPTCPKHEKWWRQDNIRVVPKVRQQPRLSLF